MDPVEYFRNHLTPRHPVPTDTAPALRHFEGIKAVIFDIYGTMLVSGAGDIGVDASNARMLGAMKETLESFGSTVPPENALAEYFDLIDELHRKSDHEYPEIEIRTVWTALLERHGLSPDLASEACVIFECAANPVWPMPELEESLSAIKSSGKRLGIISNAQFYTPLLFPALFGKELPELGFDREAVIYSYQVGEGKPSRNLYQSMKEILNTKSISPAETLYIGNDMLKDIYPARAEGFNTVLFAGDQRSLRWHHGDDRLIGISPDAIITELNQIQQLIS
ncbi:MAG: HAD family hydrolase [Verrucomicrobiales bacterium]|nr:HAD family hydrolase [Verrucomicrobiales bacterium]